MDLGHTSQCIWFLTVRRGAQRGPGGKEGEGATSCLQVAAASIMELQLYTDKGLGYKQETTSFNHPGTSGSLHGSIFF